MKREYLEFYSIALVRCRSVHAQVHKRVVVKTPKFHEGLSIVVSLSLSGNISYEGLSIVTSLSLKRNVVLLGNVHHCYTEYGFSSSFAMSPDNRSYLQKSSTLLVVGIRPNLVVYQICGSDRAKSRVDSIFTLHNVFLTAKVFNMQVDLNNRLLSTVLSGSQSC